MAVKYLSSGQIKTLKSLLSDETIEKVELRAYLHGTIADADDVIVLEGAQHTPSSRHTSDFYKSWECTVNADGIISFPVFGLEETTNSTPNDAYWILCVYSLEGKFLGYVNKKLRVPTALSPSTLAELIRYNKANEFTLPDTYLTADSVYALLDEMPLAPPGSEVQIGTVLLTAAPDGTPKAVSATDKFYTEGVLNRLRASYASLAATLTALGSAAQRKLQFFRTETIAANVTIPRNVAVDLQADAQLSANAGVTARVERFVDPGSRLVFPGDGNVYVKEKVCKLNWYFDPYTTSLSNADRRTQCFKAFKQAFNAIRESGGGVVDMSGGVWDVPGNNGTDSIAGDLTLPTNVVIDGVPSMTQIKLDPAANGKHIFRTVAGARDQIIRNIFFDLTGTTNCEAYLLRDIDGGAEAFSIGRLLFDNPVFWNGARGVNFNRQADILDTRQVVFNNPAFLGQTDRGMKINTINLQLYVFNGRFQPSGNPAHTEAACVELLDHGSLEFSNTTFEGGLGHGAPLTRTKAGILLTGVNRGVLRLVNCQNEALRYFLINDCVSDAPIEILGGLNLAKILLKHSPSVKFGGGIITIANPFEYGVGAFPRIYAEDYSFAYREGLPFDDNGDPVNPGTLEATRSGFIKIDRPSGATHRFDLSQYFRNIFTGAGDGNPTRAQVKILAEESGKVALEIGQCNSAGESENTIKIYRNGTNGHCTFEMNQVAARGYEFDGPVETPRLVRKSWAAAVLTPGAAIPMNASVNDVYTLTPNSNCTINASNLPASNNEITLIVTTGGTSSYNVDFGTGFRAGTATLATGTSDAKIWLLKFRVIGTELVEIHRPAAAA